VKPIRIACIGCGFIGRRHLENVAAIDDGEVRALMDVNPAAAEEFRASFGGAYATTVASRVFADPDVDAVIISTWHDSHEPLAVAAAAAGKHVLIEKPMALAVDSCRRINAAARRAGVVLAVNFKFRCAPAVLEVKKQIPAPVITLGQLAMNTIAPDSWVRDPSLGGGLILATACHVLDTIYWLNRSEPVRVFAEGSEDAASATVRFANGATATLLLADLGENAYAGKWLHEVFDGRRSAVLYDHFRQVRFCGVDPPHFAASDPIRDDGTYGVMEDFLHAIRTGSQPVSTGTDGIRATLLARRLIDSLRSGKPEEVHLDDAS
jgi:myo-inositol 2-dehydrogenase/D-chiro-inositol 1-dehydrogenase